MENLQPSSEGIGMQDGGGHRNPVAAADGIDLYLVGRDADSSPESISSASGEGVGNTRVCLAQMMLDLELLTTSIDVRLERIGAVVDLGDQPSSPLFRMQMGGEGPWVKTPEVELTYLNDYGDAIPKVADVHF